MNLQSLLISIVAGTLLAGCAAGARMAGRESPTPTESDMRDMVNDVEPIRPYTRYIYRVTGNDRSLVSEGVISTTPASDQDLRLLVEGSKLKIIANNTFMSTHNITLDDSEVSPFTGGTFAGGRLEVMPEFSKPVDFQPEWFPEGVTLSIDGGCNFLVRSTSPHMS